MPQSGHKKIALVLSGGGARGAYEAGIIHYIRTMLPKTSRGRIFDINCGASVGAINTAFVSATAHEPLKQGIALHQLWEKMKEEHLYRRDKMALWQFLSTSGRGIFMNLIRGADRQSAHFHGFLDTSPFAVFLKNNVPWSMISKNIRNGVIQAISVVATNVLTGKMELFIDKAPHVKYTGEYVTRYTKIQPVHAMASSAIPIVFPTVLVNGVPYTDGGLRLNTPMSPAIQLGADSILVVGLHHRPKAKEIAQENKRKGQQAPLGQVLGRVMNSIFLDRVQYDIEQLQRINRIVDWAELLYGDHFMADLNKMIKKKNIKGDIANRGLKRLHVLRIHPSEDIGNIFTQCFLKGRDRHFSSFEKFLVRFLDIDPTSGNDFLSYLSFMPEYVKALLDLGFEDARRHHSELHAFLEQ